jgi:hypothetical protein
MDPGPHVNLDLGFTGIRLTFGGEGFNMPVALPISVIDYPSLAPLALGGCPRSLSNCYRLSPSMAASSAAEPTAEV